MVQSVQNAAAASVHAASRSNDPCYQPLDFTVRVAGTELDLRRVQQLRQAAYGHHLPDKALEFGQAEAIDRHADVLVLMAECKQTGTVVGSARIQINRTAPLQIERSIALPPSLQDRLLCEITRLTVLPGYGDPLVRPALVKASYLYNVAFKVHATLAGSRRSLLRQYHRLGFSDLFEAEPDIPLVHACGLPHRVLWLATADAQARLRERHPSLHTFVVNTWHPDITGFGTGAHAPLARHWKPPVPSRVNAGAGAVRSTAWPRLSNAPSLGRQTHPTADRSGTRVLPWQQ